MQVATNRSSLARASGIAVALVIVLAPLSAVAQRAGSTGADTATPPPFLQSVLRDLAPQPRDIPPVRPNVAKLLNDAIAALNAKMYSDARASIGELQLDRLNPYELGVAEVTLFYIAYAEKMLSEARQHLVNAIESGGLSASEIATAQRNIERIDRSLEVAPLT